MTDKVEERLGDYYHELESRAEETTDSLLESAVLRGMERGKLRYAHKRRTYIGVTAAALILLLYIAVSSLGSLNVLPKQAKQQPKSWNQLEVFRPDVEHNITLKSALDAGYVQYFEKAVAESDGYKISVNGAVVDRRGLILLYTFENKTGKKVKVDGMVLKDKSGKDLKYGMYSSFYGGDKFTSPVTHDFFEVMWADSKFLERQLTVDFTIVENTPEAMLSSSTKYRTLLSVPITLDDLAIRTAGEEVSLNKTLAIAGQSMVLKKAYIGPTGVYVNMQYSPSNTMNIYSLIGTKLIQGEGIQAIELGNSISYGDPNDRTLVFANNNMDNDGTIKLTIKGIHALDKSKQKLVLDTDKMKIMQAPDQNLKWASVKKDHPAGEIALKYTAKNRGEGYEETMGSLGLDFTFTDGDGILHNLSTGDSHTLQQEQEGYSTTSYYFYFIGTEKLPQPLTFKLISYPHPILEPHSFKIR